VCKKWILLLALAVSVSLLGCGIIGDLSREDWCQEQGYGAGIIKRDGVYYCAGDQDVRLPDYLQGNNSE